MSGRLPPIASEESNPEERKRASNNTGSTLPNPAEVRFLLPRMGPEAGSPICIGTPQEQKARLNGQTQNRVCEMAVVQIYFIHLEMGLPM